MKYTALIVEDDHASREYLRVLLGIFGLNPLVAEDGEKALLLMRDQQADLFLIDIALGPGIDGIEVCRRLKKDIRNSDTPAIAVTAFEKDELVGFESAGFSEYLPKPYTADQLRTILEKCDLQVKMCLNTESIQG